MRLNSSSPSVAHGSSRSHYSPLIITRGSTDRLILVVMNYSLFISKHFDLFRRTVLQPIESETQGAFFKRKGFPCELK